MRIATKRRHTLTSLIVAVAFVALAHSAAAQGPGVRGGLSVDPDQGFIGGHYETGAIVDRVHFKPNVEIGFGDHVTLVAINFEGIYKFPSRSNWHVYAGGGPTLSIVDFEDNTDTEAGFNFLGGIETTRGLAFEVKFGVGDAPDVKFSVGYTFR